MLLSCGSLLLSINIHNFYHFTILTTKIEYQLSTKLKIYLTVTLTLVLTFLVRDLSSKAGRRKGGTVLNLFWFKHGD